MINHNLYPLVMVDIETMDTVPTARVLSIGAVRFNHTGEYDDGYVFYRHPSLVAQKDRTVSESTMAFWNEQDKSVYQEAFKGEEHRLSVVEIYSELMEFMRGCTEVWANSPTFDLMILENLFADCGPSIWGHRDERDVRTVKNIWTGDYTEENKNPHNPVDDCIHQIKQVTPLLSRYRND